MDWTPDLRQLRALVAVAEEGSFTLAAKKLSLTQSAVSHSLRSLENQLGCRLLDRSGKRVVVTSEGDILLKRCKRVLHELEQATRDLDGLKRWGQTEIRVGAPHSLCHFIIPSVLREFRDCFPRCEPNIEAADTAVLLERLAQGELDLVVGLKPNAYDSEAYRPMFHDKLIFLISPMHAWAKAQDNMIPTLGEQQFIIYAKSTETHRLIQNWVTKVSGKMNKPLVLGDMQAIKEMAKLGTGVGIVAPWVASKEITDGSLNAIEIPGPQIEREWGVFHSPDRQPSLIEETFIGLCEMAFNHMPK